MGVHIASLNVDGLRDSKKRAKLFEFFTNSNYDIILLQETHVQNEDIVPWSREWQGSYADWNPGPSTSSCGTGILMTNRKQIVIVDYAKDQYGRILNTKIQYIGETAQIISLWTKQTRREK